ncbi:MAG: cupin domain-containing protein [Pirellulales bacterium]|nr:cupin domain-containing protein [Pirellulales bacterium]
MINSNAHYEPVITPSMGARRMHVHLTEINDARKGWGYQHCHEAEEAVYMLEGEGEFTFDGKTYHVGPGQAVFFPSGIVHAETKFLSDKVKYLVIRTVEPGDEPCCCETDVAAPATATS